MNLLTDKTVEKLKFENKDEEFGAKVLITHLHHKVYKIINEE